MGYVNFNGKLFPTGTALVTADNRGLRYGDGLFETMKFRSGKLQFQSAHFNRLWHGLTVLGFELPKHFTKEKLAGEIHLLCKKNGIDHIGRIRLNVFRADGGLYDPIDHFPRYAIQAWPLPDETGQLNSNGLVAGIYGEARKALDVLCNLKHNNFLPYALGAIHARNEKWNDAILLNTNGDICDTTIANIFLVKDNVLVTPALAEGCVAGVMREMLLNHLLMENYTVSEQAVTVDDLLAADEVFFTNSMHVIKWVQRVGDRNYGNKLTPDIFRSFLPTIS
jgi:branched-chain amino acid aminotransferase